MPPKSRKKGSPKGGPKKGGKGKSPKGGAAAAPRAVAPIKKGGKKAGGKKAPTRVTNSALSSGIMRLSRSTLRRKKGVQGVKSKNGGKFPTTAPKAKAAPAAAAASKFYPTEDKKVPLNSRKSKQNPVKVRSSITPVSSAPGPKRARAPVRPNPNRRSRPASHCSEAVRPRRANK